MPQDKILEQAKYHFKKNNFDIAKSILLQTIGLKKAKSPHFEILGYVYGNLGDKKKCLHYLSMACEFSNATPEAHFYLGKELIQMDEYQSGIQHLHKSLNKAGNFFEALFELGIGYQKIKKFPESLRFFKESAKVNPNSLEAIFNIGRLYSEELNQPQKGLQFYDQLLAIEPRNYEVWIARGNAYSLLGDYTQALLCYSKSVEINPQSAIGWNHYGLSLLNSNNITQAYDAFKNAYKLDPLNSTNITNIALIKIKDKNYQEAKYFLEKALQLNNNSFEALIGKAQCEFNLNQITEAFSLIDNAIKLNPDRAEGWFWKGCFYSNQKKYSLAVSQFEIAKKLNYSHLPFLPGFLLETKIKSFDWNGLDLLLTEVKENILKGVATVQPLIFQAINLDPVLNQKCGNSFSSAFFINHVDRKISKKRNQKIRIAYISPDFRNHPVMHLTHDIYRLHDRSKFDVLGCFLNKESDGYTEKVSDYFDEIFKISHLSDYEIINLLRNQSIDIAIDLAGHTQGSRLNIFLNRIAPIQINFIGFPGTMGSNQYDFIIGDNIVSPLHENKFYSEKILNLPRIFQPNSTRPTSSTYKEKKFYGLTENSFIFCCFNSNYKITQEIFDTWIEILKATSNSILWLFTESDDVKENINNRLKGSNISVDRIVYANFLSYSEHLSRLRFANLFLDTFPFNAGTTCSDLLWANVPVLTISGESFCGKMSASLLRYLDMNELISNSIEEYKQKAINLCNNTNLYFSIKKKLEASLKSSDIYNISKYVSELEDIYISLSNE